LPGGRTGSRCGSPGKTRRPRTPTSSADAERIAAYLSEQGFPEPLRADSGNGAHLLYRVDLPNDEAATEVVRGVLTTLDALFSNETITVDTANYNASRIWKLYGTMSRKGDSTPTGAQRPSRFHR